MRGSGILDIKKQCLAQNGKILASGPALLRSAKRWAAVITRLALQFFDQLKVLVPEKAGKFLPPALSFLSMQILRPSTLQSSESHLSRIRLFYNLTHVLLIESLETFPPLQVFQMAAYRTKFGKFFSLLGADLPHPQQTACSLRRNFPNLSFGKRLSQKSKVTKGLHHLHASLRQISSEMIEVKLCFQVVHPGLQNRVPMQGAPESDGTELSRIRQLLVGEIDRNFFRR